MPIITIAEIEQWNTLAPCSFPSPQIEFTKIFKLNSINNYYSLLLITINYCYSAYGKQYGSAP